MITKAPSQPRGSVQSPEALLPSVSWELVDAGLQGHIYMAWTGAPAGRAAPSRLAGGDEPGAGSGQGLAGRSAGSGCPVSQHEGGRR